MMGLFPLKGKADMVRETRRTLWAMQEIGRIATAAGLDTLAKLTQSPIETDPSRVALVPRDAVGRHWAHHKGAEVAGRFTFHGSAAGLVATLFARQDALSLVDLLMGNDPGTTKQLGELETSAVAEMTNITLNSALNAVATESGLRFRSDVPEVVRGINDPDAFFSFDGDAAADHMLVIETPFRAGQGPMSGTFVLTIGIEGTPEP